LNTPKAKAFAFEHQNKVFVAPPKQASSAGLIMKHFE